MDKEKKAFYHLGWLELSEFIKYLNKRDGYLIAQ